MVLHKGDGYIFEYLLGRRGYVYVRLAQTVALPGRAETLYKFFGIMESGRYLRERIGIRIRDLP